jgi:hypothetical protein
VNCKIMKQNTHDNGIFFVFLRVELVNGYRLLVMGY